MGRSFWFNFHIWMEIEHFISILINWFKWLTMPVGNDNTIALTCYNIELTWKESRHAIGRQIELFLIWFSGLPGNNMNNTIISQLPTNCNYLKEYLKDVSNLHIKQNKYKQQTLYLVWWSRNPCWVSWLVLLFLTNCELELI